MFACFCSVPWVFKADILQHSLRRKLLCKLFDHKGSKSWKEPNMSLQINWWRESQYRRYTEEGKGEHVIEKFKNLFQISLGWSLDLFKNLQRASSHLTPDTFSVGNGVSQSSMIHSWLSQWREEGICKSWLMTNFCQAHQDKWIVLQNC